MHIILTNHCLQRREYLPKREEKEISKWIVFFIKKFHFKTKKDDIYIVKCKGNKAVIKKEKKRLVIITFIGFKDNLFKNKEAYDFKCSSEKLKYRIWRKNYVGRIVSCGSLNYNEDQSINIIFQNRMINKFIIPDKYLNKNYKSIDEIDFLTFINNKYILNIDFERKFKLN